MRLSRSDISPDGVRIIIDWSGFVVGTSLFIPCVNAKVSTEYVFGELVKSPRTPLVNLIAFE